MVDSIIEENIVCNRWVEINDYFTNDLKYATSISSVNFLKNVNKLKDNFSIMEVRGNGFCLLNSLNVLLNPNICFEQLYNHYMTNMTKKNSINNEIEKDYENVARNKCNDLSDVWIQVISSFKNIRIIVISCDQVLDYNSEKEDVYFLIHWCNHYYIAKIIQPLNKVVSLLKNIYCPFYVEIEV